MRYSFTCIHSMFLSFFRSLFSSFSLSLALSRLRSGGVGGGGVGWSFVLYFCYFCYFFSFLSSFFFDRYVHVCLCWLRSLV
ncbi:hypothetical protein DFP73DRAFT_336914 [Morchella snyderi]|nr:hypothetical protein DFP73DRAFT_336914 [Morchella snyderi]